MKCLQCTYSVLYHTILASRHEHNLLSDIVGLYSRVETCTHFKKLGLALYRFCGNVDGFSVVLLQKNKKQWVGPSGPAGYYYDAQLKIYVRQFNFGQTLISDKFPLFEFLGGTLQCMQVSSYCIT